MKLTARVLKLDGNVASLTWEPDSKASKRHAKKLEVQSLKILQVSSIENDPSLFPGTYREKVPGTSLTIQESGGNHHFQFGSETIAHFFKEGMQLVVSHAQVMDKRESDKARLAASATAPRGPWATSDG